MMSVILVALGSALTITQIVLILIAVETAVAVAETLDVEIVVAVVADETKRTKVKGKTSHNSTFEKLAVS
jgi:hypothetical protein